MSLGAKLSMEILQAQELGVHTSARAHPHLTGVGFYAAKYHALSIPPQWATRPNQGSTLVVTMASHLSPDIEKFFYPGASENGNKMGGQL